MRTIFGYAVVLGLLGLGQWLASRPPAWLDEDPLSHPFGRDVGPEFQDPEQSRASDGGNSDAAAMDTVAFPIDLRNANRAELLALPRIGPAMAERILAHRDSFAGSFGLRALEAVRGIGPKTLALLQPLVVAESDSTDRY